MLARRARTLNITSMSGFMFFLVIIAMLLTLFALFGGIISMVVGGDFNLRYGNKLMRYRVLMQAVALLLFAIAMAGS